MAEHPIIFTGPSVLAIQAGTKTMTRRVTRPQPDQVIDGEPWWNIGGFTPPRCPYGEPGDTLYVKETCQIVDGVSVAYRADFKTLKCAVNDAGRAMGLVTPHVETGEWIEVDASEDDFNWRSPLFMPRQLSRIDLTVKDVRVELVQDITEADAKAEGETPQFEPVGLSAAFDLTHLPYSSAYANTWDEINAKRGHGWDTNPLVWVIEFERKVAHG